MTTKEKARILQCMQCPIFRFSLSDYVTLFFPHWEAYKKKENLRAIEDIKDFADAVQTIIEDLKIDCKIDFDAVCNKHDKVEQIRSNDIKLYNDIENFTQEMGKLSEKRRAISTSLFPNTRACAKSLNCVLPMLVPYLEPRDYPVKGFSNEYRYIFDLMESVARNEPIDPQSKQSFMTPNSNDKINPGKIIGEYCRIGKDVSYKYCNPDLAEWNDYNNLCDCRDIETQSTASRPFPSLERLNSQSQKLVYEFLFSVPKAFGENLSRIMQIQGLSEQDLSTILYDTEYKANRIQALCQCRTHNQSPEQIKKLARALLVSEDVLYTGRGVIYGNWKKLLNQYEYKDTMETLGERTKKEAKEEMRHIIKEMITQEDDDFERMLSHEFFYKQPCYLYLRDCVNFTRIIDHRFYQTEHHYSLNWEKVVDESLYDFNAMYQATLHPEYIDILISVLSEKQPNV